MVPKSLWPKFIEAKKALLSLSVIIILTAYVSMYVCMYVCSSLTESKLLTKTDFNVWGIDEFVSIVFTGLIFLWKVQYGICGRYIIKSWSKKYKYSD